MAPQTIAILGDMSMYNSNNTFADLARIAPSLDWIWHVGDISYADDGFLHDPLVDNYDATWDSFMTAIEPYAGGMAYMVLPGNHEAGAR